MALVFTSQSLWARKLCFMSAPVLLNVFRLTLLLLVVGFDHIWPRCEVLHAEAAGGGSSNQNCLFIIQVVPVILHLITSISSVRLYIPKDLRPYDNRQSMLKSIQVSARAHTVGIFLMAYYSCVCVYAYICV